MGSSSDILRRPETPPTRVRYLVLFWLCLAAMIAYIHRNIGVAEGTIRSDLGLSRTESARAMSIFFITYALFQIPAGWLGHVWGTRRALPFFAIISSLMTGIAGWAGGYPGLLLSRLGMGAAQAGLFPCSVSTVGKWFPLTQRAMANGVLGSFMSVGSAAGAMVTGVFLEFLSWRWLFLLYAVPGVLWAVGFFRWFRDRPVEHPSVNTAELDLIRGSLLKGDSLPAEDHPEPTPWRMIFTSPGMWCICGQAIFRSAAYMFYTTWFTTYLKETRAGTTGWQAGFLTSLPLWAVVVGSPLGGLLSDRVLARTGSRRLARTGVAVVSMLASALFILLAYPVANVWLFVLLISASSFVASFGAPCGYTVTIDMGGKHITTVFAIMNMAGNVGAMAFPEVVSRLRDATGSWNAVLFLFAGIYLAAALCWLPINPDRPIVGRLPDDSPRR